MSDKKEEATRQTVRFDPDVYTEIVELAKANKHRPAISFNRMLMFVLRAGLKALKEAEQTPGNHALVYQTASA